MFFTPIALALASTSLLATSQLIEDPIGHDPSIEVVHLYYDQFPTGIAVSRSGRKFSNYPGGLDSNNTNDGTNGRYTIAELLPNNTERAYPSVEINSPPGGAINYTTTPPTGANDATHLLGAQSCVIDSADRLWILDTGRTQTPSGVQVPATPGGPKLIGVDLGTDSVFTTITFPPTVALPTSYLNDVRLDLRPHLTPSGHGVAYITDSSSAGTNALITVDLGTHESWRHLDGTPQVRPVRQHLFYQWGRAIYSAGSDYTTYGSTGADGIALSADGETLFWKVLSDRNLYSIPTSNLRDRTRGSEIRAQGAVRSRGETGVSDGLETDSNGMVYFGNMEVNGVGVFDPQEGTAVSLVRDTRVNWVDTFATGFDGWLYFTVNQLVFGPGFGLEGEDERVKPWAVMRVPLPGNGTKAVLL